MSVMPLLVVGFSVFYMLESFLHCQPLPSYRHRHAFTNLIVTAFNLSTLSLCGLGIAALSSWAAANNIGLFNVFKYDDPIVTSLQFLLVLIVYDLVNYWIHRSQHMLSWLWPLHRIHHSDPYLDVTSSFRFHPFESIYRASIQSVVVISLGMSLAQISAYLFCVVANLLFSHTNILLPRTLDRTIGWFVVTPDLHRVHHSVERRWHDSNYGIILSVWDRLFKSYSDPDKAGPVNIGLRDYQSASTLTVGEILRDPFIDRSHPSSEAN
jgi:sterol desaturase/sphingolipid hydroxylase (fatty acid hydroxylase superfamily)